MARQHEKTLWSKGYSHLTNSRGGWNKRGGDAKLPELINEEVGINVEGGIFWKKLVHKCNKRGAEGGKNLSNKRGGWIFFSKSINVTPRLLER